jgi:DNA primase
MSKSSFVDFKAVKSAITIEQVLDHYGLLDKFKRSGDNLSGPCPIHKGSNPTQFRVSVSKNIWNCFSECKGGGNVLDFIAKMENETIYASALKAIEWFGLDVAGMSPGSGETGKPRTKSSKKESTPGPKASLEPASPEPDEIALNKPLKFRLEKLERTHPYLAQRGLTVETVVDFGVGYCAKGMMAGRIAIPITNAEGNIVAYAGRFPGEAPGDTPKYKLPPGFRKSLELFNIDRALKQPDEQPLIIVEGFFDCMKLHQSGVHKVVALMGSTMSDLQEELLRKESAHWNRVIIMLDEDEAGQAGREDIAVRLAKIAFVKIHVFPASGMQPDQMPVEALRELLGGAQ